MVWKEGYFGQLGFLFFVFFLLLLFAVTCVIFYVCATRIEISSIPWALGGVLKVMNDNAVLKTGFLSLFYPFE
jgi:hypothetical protein